MGYKFQNQKQPGRRPSTYSRTAAIEAATGDCRGAYTTQDVHDPRSHCPSHHSFARPSSCSRGVVVVVPSTIRATAAVSVLWRVDSEGWSRESDRCGLPATLLLESSETRRRVKTRTTGTGSRETRPSPGSENQSYYYYYNVLLLRGGRCRALSLHTVYTYNTVRLKHSAECGSGVVAVDARLGLVSGRRIMIDSSPYALCALAHSFPPIRHTRTNTAHVSFRPSFFFWSPGLSLFAALCSFIATRMSCHAHLCSASNAGAMSWTPLFRSSPVCSPYVTHFIHDLDPILLQIVVAMVVP